MRFMMIVKATNDSEAGVMPDETLIAAMMKYNEELANAGVLLDLAGLQPSSKETRIKFSRGKRTVIDGPFPNYVRADRRLLADPCQLEGGSDRMGETLPRTAR
jgi:hypothetical protein